LPILVTLILQAHIMVAPGITTSPISRAKEGVDDKFRQKINDSLKFAFIKSEGAGNFLKICLVFFKSF
jgi:hypothetical protein